VLSSLCGNGPVDAFLHSLRTELDTGFKLTTGLSMELLWKHFRPIVVSSFQRVETLLKMEKLARRFDALKWNVSISVSELGGIMNSLVKAYRLVLTSEVDGESLISTLGEELGKLEANIFQDKDHIEPFFTSQFEGLRQFQTLEAMRLGVDGHGLMDSDTIVIANYPTTSEMQLSSSSATSRSLQMIDYLWGPGNGLQPITDSYSANLLDRLNELGEVDLKNLRLLESELPILGEKLASSGGILCREHVVDLNKRLLDLIVVFFSIHGGTDQATYAERIRARMTEAAEFQNISLPDLTKIIEERRRRVISSFNEDEQNQLIAIDTTHFHPAILCIAASAVQSQDKTQFSALAWIYFAVGCLKLYVPDQVFDPDKRQRLERERHLELRETLRKKLAALQQFEHLVTGQDTNLRSQLLEEEIMELGEPAELLQKIYRPEVSELDQLQGEFKNLLTTVVLSDLPDKVLSYFQDYDGNALREIKLIQNNVLQIIRRLSESFKAYNDLTSPAISMLRCLQIGLFMATVTTPSLMSTATSLSQVSATISPTREIILGFSRMTPFLGANNSSYLTSDKNILSNHPMEYLAAVATVTATEGIASLDSMLRQYLLEAIHGCYERWAQKLYSERLEEESKSGLYRFKGSADDEQEEDQAQFNELFPTYEDDSHQPPNSTSSVRTARDAAIQLAKVHATIFLDGSIPSKTLLSLIRRMSRKIGSLHDDIIPQGETNLTSTLLPGVFLLLNDQIEALSSVAPVSESYNFYSDAHLPETRKLVDLIHQVQARFYELQAVDEIGHMQPLQDVLVSCRELLQFRHTEPLAKIITKLEKLHGFMHEWQYGGWASRANSALALYDSITSTIINWRRLELSTWAKLFDMEAENCNEDARSWWFLAYQVIIAVPLSMAESSSPDELESYAQKLLKDLEDYFSTTIVGQFTERLRLLKQLQKHLEVFILDIPPMSIISDALANFISLYGRYEKPVAENLKKGRLSLEKSVRDVILLATWKDTNIIALRDSAKRSHHNLFKIVRKFRSLLGQPMDVILKQGLPDETTADFEAPSHDTPVQFPTVKLSALALCAETVPRWAEKSKRFVNVSKTVSLMVDTSEIPESAVDASAYLKSFLANLLSSSAELQKATPSILTEDNKDLVKHLKSRKRKLFADTLRDLRNMGIKYNLGADALAKQDSLPTILASTKPLSPVQDFDPKSLQYYFQKSVDFAPRIRRAIRQHSEDLSSTDVARSTGFLEGLLQVVLIQRNALSAAVTKATKLDQAVKIVEALWAPKAYIIKNVETVSNHKSLLRWMPAILSVGIELVQIHSKLGKTDNKSVEESICSWMNRFIELSAQLDAVPETPSNIISTAGKDLDNLIKDSTMQLRSELESLSENRPDLSFIVDQILLWARTEETSICKDTHMTMTDLDQKLSIVCDAILLATEKYQKSISELPTSTEDPGWLVRNGTILATSIKSLHPEDIIQQLQQAFEVLRCLNLEDDQISKTAAALFTVAQPILRQYYNILQQAVTRYADLHRVTCKTSYILAKTFSQIASQGFCAPSEQSDSQDGKTEKLEGGTGLGDGEGAEDISKDIQDDENLDELAQEPNTGEKGEIEDEKDAVDMADGEMEGEIGEGEENDDDEGESGEDERGDEIDEEAGDVDDLDPTTVDEKMWDGDTEEAEKDQEGDESKGKQSKDEQAAGQDNNKEIAELGEDEEEEEELEGAEQGEEIKQQDDVERHDPHAQEGEVLDLPEDMELDGNGEEESAGGSDDGINDLSGVEEEEEEEEEIQNDGKEDTEGEDMDPQEDQDIVSEMDVIDLDEEKEDTENKIEEAGEKVESDSEEQQSEDQDGLLRDTKDEATADAENAVPSEVQGAGEDQDETSPEEKNESASKAQREDGGKGGDSSEQNEAAAEDGEKGRQAKGDAPQDSRDETKDSTDAEPFKKLGDALESWHRQQTNIREAPESKEQGQDQHMDMNAQNPEFQHLQDENAEADTQALGTATEEQAHVLDESMAIDPESKELPEQFQPDEVEQEDADQDDVMDLEDSQKFREQEPSDAYEGHVGAVINQTKHNRDDDLIDPRAPAGQVLEEDVDEVDIQLESTHLDTLGVPDLRSAADARQQWTHYEALTRDLSLSLTEQLRLILAPTLATKMRGDFRTGKRLNIKRIIPYIASQYKRDKIWMRRSVPSKRSYQVMLAVDDSKSMGESGSGSLAFETLVMVSKSLSMLEVGEICVVGFGENVKVAHDFETPFSSEAGPRIFQNFGFEQSRTDVTKLVRESIQLFRTARRKASGSPADLWQMQLIISDGVCDSSEHEPIRRLLREAIEERIMMVFVIVDDLKNKKKGESVMDLKEAKFVKDESTGLSNVKIERYLDTFPFQYYLIVSDVKELPGVLATLLRQWFAEVVDAST
jgi:midasin